MKELTRSALNVYSVYVYSVYSVYALKRTDTKPEAG